MGEGGQGLEVELLGEVAVDGVAHPQHVAIRPFASLTHV